MPEELKAKAVGSIKWGMLASYGHQAVGLASRLALSWLLLPDDWGRVAAAMMLITLVRSCGNFGINYALVQWRGDLRAAAHTALTLLFGISALAYVVVAAGAPFTKGYFADPAVPLLTYVLALSLLLRPPGVVAEGTLRREFRLRAIFAIEIVSHVLSAAAAVAVALVLPREFRCWALVVGGLGREGLGALLSWRLSNVPLRFRFDREAAKGLMHYGKFFVIGSILMVLYLNLDRMVLGNRHIGSMEMLGLYAFALDMVMHLGMVSDSIFGGVAVPLYAKLRDDPERLRSSYCRILGYSALVSTGLLVGMIVVVPEAIRLILRPEYHASVPIFQVLGLFCIVRAIDTTAGQLYVAVGRPDYDMYAGAANLVALAALIVPMVIAYGAVGAAAAVLAARLARMAVSAVLCRRVLACPVSRFVASLMPAAGASALMAGAVLGAKLLLRQAGIPVGWLVLGALIALGGLVFVAAVYAIHRPLFLEVWGLIRDALLPRRARRHEPTA